jgi:putative protein kinase ArgK-like GTPase of G3E family
MGKTITTFTDISQLMREGINKVTQVASINKDDERISLHTPRTVKSENKLARVLSKKYWNMLNKSIPKETIPPKHILTEDSKSKKILEVIQTHETFCQLLRTDLNVLRITPMIPFSTSQTLL